MPPPRPSDLEALDRLPPTKSGRGQDALPQALGRARPVSGLRPPGCRASNQGSHSEPLHCPRNADHAARRIGLSREREGAAVTGFAQQSRLPLPPSQDPRRTMCAFPESLRPHLALARCLRARRRFLGGRTLACNSRQATGLTATICRQSLLHLCQMQWGPRSRSTRWIIQQLTPMAVEQVVQSMQGGGR